MRPWRKKREPYKELQSGDAGLTVNDVMTDKQVREFTNTVDHKAFEGWEELEI